MVSARSVHKEAAFRVAQFLTSDVEAQTRWAKAGQLVANASVYAADAVRRDPVTMAFRQQLGRTQTLSNQPVVRQIWTPLGRALSQVVTRGRDIEKALDEAARAFEKAIK